MRRVLVGAWFCALLSACAAEGVQERVLVPETEIRHEDGAVRASFRAGTWASGQQSIWVRLAAVEGRIGAYQASVVFDPAAITLVESAMTDASGGQDFGIANTEPGTPGLVRLAGFSIEGFEVRDVVELRFRSPRPLTSSDLRLELDVVGTVEGTEISADELDVLSEVLPMDQPGLGR